MKSKIKRYLKSETLVQQLIPVLVLVFLILMANSQ
jgi:hypothetical protein